MKLKESQIKSLVTRVLEDWKKSHVIKLKTSESAIVDRMMESLRQENEKLVALELEVKQMMEQLERQNAGPFDRQKMYGLLKQRLAKEKGIIL